MTSFREKLTQDELQVLPGAYDALTARLVEKRGFKATYLGGWTLGASLGWGEPRTNLTDLTQRAKEIVSAVDIPLVVDGNAGFGDAVHVERTVRLAQTVGIAGMHIEDQLYPKRMHYHAGIEHIVEREEIMAKIDAAVEARGDDPFAIIGRSDGIMAANGTYEEAVSRCNEYLERGADAAMLFPETEEQLKSAPELINGPVVYVWPEEQGGMPRPTLDELRDLGYRAVIYPILAIACAFEGVESGLDALASEGAPEKPGEKGLEQATSRIEEVLDFEKAYEVERRTTEKATN